VNVPAVASLVPYLGGIAVGAGLGGLGGHFAVQPVLPHVTGFETPWPGPLSTEDAQAVAHLAGIDTGAILGGGLGAYGALKAMGLKRSPAQSGTAGLSTTIPAAIMGVTPVQLAQQADREAVRAVRV
jgi:hypothetical protein